MAAPPTATAGQVPAEAMATARETFAGLGLAGLVGGAVGVTASLLIEPGSGRASVVMASRLIPTANEQVNGRLLRPDA